MADDSVSCPVVNNLKPRGRRLIPLWVWLLILALACVTPVSHYWISRFPPAGTAFTGMRSVDDAMFRLSLRQFGADFRSPYVLCTSPFGPDRLPSYPPTWLLGALGLLGNALGVEEFLYLGICNGLGALLYLLAVYVLLCELAPRQANLAFVLHVLGGGLAGVAFISCGIAGMRALPGFHDEFFRVARHELLEGAHLNPIPMFPRIYYTVSLAGLFTAFALVHRFVCSGGKWRLTLAGPLAFAGTMLNVRFGAPVLCVVLLWLLCAKGRNVRRRVAVGVLFGGTVALGTMAFVAVLKTNAAVIGNQVELLRTAVWFSSFVSAGIWYLVAAAGPSCRAIRRLPLFPRVAAYGLSGWLFAFVLLYLAYNAYYGALLAPADFSAGVWASDKALLGAVAGMVLGVRCRGAEAQEETDWVAVWGLLMILASLGAFFGGWYLRLTPIRLLIMASVPLCILSAQGIQSFARRHPVGARLFTGVFIACGICSQAVSLLHYLGPVETPPGYGYASMSVADSESLDLLGDGTVLTPLGTAPSFGDIIALRPTTNTVFGIASMGLSGLVWPPVRDDVQQFFSPDATEGFRRAVVDRYCVDYVFCPNTTPVSEEALRGLQATAWLDVVGCRGNACLFRVRKWGK